MDSCEAAQMVFARVKSLEPSSVSRIMGYLLLQDHSNTEMFNLAFGTDAELKEAVAKAKKELLASDQARDQRKNTSPPVKTQASSDPGRQQPRNRAASPHTNPPKPRASSPPEETSTPCKFFTKGYCRLGASCPYVHTSSSSKPKLEDASEINARQIYLTFPADSRFTEEDVLLYFSSYGVVEDVRIPSQPKRMFGFVTFQHRETARAILLESNPHFICGARVLVKPYRDRPMTERKQPDSGFAEDDCVGNLMGSDAARMAEEDKRNSELERKLAELHLANSRAKMEAALLEASSHMEQTRVLSKFLQPDAGHGSMKNFYHNALPVSLPIQGVQKFPSDSMNYMGPPGFPHGYTFPSSGGPYYGGPQLSPSIKPSAPVNLSAAAGSSLSLDTQLMCCICFEFSADPIQLDCAHIFCAQCLLKAVQSSEDECPVCSRNSGKKIHKIQTRDVSPWFAPSTDSSMQPIW